MPVLFKCKTGEAYQIKVLAELLTNNLKNGCFDVSEEGITLRMFDEHQITLVDLDLEAENFPLYIFKSDQKICLGLLLNLFHKMMKSIKKKDSIQLYIDTKNPNELNIKSIPKENTRKTTSTIPTQNIQYVECDIPVGYGKPIIVPSPDFQKMCKELSSIGSAKIYVVPYTFYIDFIADSDNLMKRAVRLGETDDSDVDSDDEDDDRIKSTFTSDQLGRISKIAGLGTTMQIFPGSDDLPFLFRSNVGSLGKISIYIKSEELIEKKAMEDSESEDSDDD